MADVNVGIPAPREPFLNADGTVNRFWWIFLEDLWQRTGGPLNDKVEEGVQGAETAQAAADTATAAAAAAQGSADDAQTAADAAQETANASSARLDFGISIDLL